MSIRRFAECVADLSGVKVVFANPADWEDRSFNPMNNSTLKAEKLLTLGWVPRFPLREGVDRMLRYGDWTE